MNKEELQNLVNTSSSISDIIRRQGKAVSGTSIKLLKQEFDLYQIDYHNFFYIEHANLKNK